MKVISMSGSLRENVGKKDAKAYRRAGFVPAVLYGGAEQKLLLLSVEEVEAAIITPVVYLIDLTLDGKKHQCVIKDLQSHPVTDEIIHLDLLEVLPDKPITISLPLNLNGTPKGVLQGGKLVKKFRKLKVKGLAANLPATIEVNISKLDVNEFLYIRDIQIENIQILDLPNAVVAGIKSTRSTATEAAPTGKK
ncbi:MAG TPA: 50S ribosomal protein L25 [Bacteroidales bacterium]|jgi:large subunit ribosomal protein L25|nr:50S ribosomal protein L25 [Bacteroidales bacterium]